MAKIFGIEQPVHPMQRQWQNDQKMAVRSEPQSESISDPKQSKAECKVARPCQSGKPPMGRIGAISPDQSPPGRVWFRREFCRW
jgi:hypothetical protein